MNFSTKGLVAALHASVFFRGHERRELRQELTGTAWIFRVSALQCEPQQEEERRRESKYLHGMKCRAHGASSKLKK